MKHTTPSYLSSLTNISTTQSKMLIMAIVILYIVMIFNIVLSRFNTTDVVPQLKAINTEVLKKLGTFTVRVKVGMFIKNFPVFDVAKNTFLIDSVIWFEFNGDEITLDTIQNFSIDNGKINYKSPPDIKVNADKIFAKYNVLFELKTDLNFHKFPFEDHRLPVILTNDFVTPDEMFFVVDASSFQIQRKIAPAGWQFSDTSVDAGFLPLQLDTQDDTKKAESPKALFVLNFIKASARKTLIIFMPLFAGLFLSLFAFLVNTSNVAGKFSLAITAVTALLGYRFVIEQMMPQVGYFTTTDALYLFLVLLSFLNVSVQLLITRRYNDLQIEPNEEIKRQSLSNLERISNIIFLLMILLLVGIVTYIMLT